MGTIKNLGLSKPHMKLRMSEDGMESKQTRGGRAFRKNSGLARLWTMVFHKLSNSSVLGNLEFCLLAEFGLFIEIFVSKYP